MVMKLRDTLYIGSTTKPFDVGLIIIALSRLVIYSGISISQSKLQFFKPPDYSSEIKVVLPHQRLLLRVEDTVDVKQ